MSDPKIQLTLENAQKMCDRINSYATPIEVEYQEGGQSSFASVFKIAVPDGDGIRILVPYVDGGGSPAWIDLTDPNEPAFVTFSRSHVQIEWGPAEHRDILTIKQR